MYLKSLRAIKSSVACVKTYRIIPSINQQRKCDFFPKKVLPTGAKPFGLHYYYTPVRLKINVTRAAPNKARKQLTTNGHSSSSILKINNTYAWHNNVGNWKIIQIYVPSLFPIPLSPSALSLHVALSFTIHFIERYECIYVFMYRHFQQQTGRQPIKVFPLQLEVSWTEGGWIFVSVSLFICWPGGHRTFGRSYPNLEG